MEQNLQQIRNKIVSILKLKGPSLPVQISREIGIEALFTSALLSELASEKTIKISSMKVGNSPLYFLAGQEPQLEKFSSYLPQKEKEAYLLVKKKKMLQDSKQLPAIRVALRNIKDFAFPLLINTPQGEELFWRFYSLSEEEAREKLRPKRPETEISKKEKPILELKETKPKKRKEKSAFVNKIISDIEAANIEILEEKEFKKREYIATVRINSDIGKLSFLVIAKDKKRISENDLTLALQKSQTEKLPILFLSPGELNKKALAYLEQHSGLIKFKRIV
jgi:hypothetical protein